MSTAVQKIDFQEFTRVSTFSGIISRRQIVFQEIPEVPGVVATLSCAPFQ